MRIGKYKGEPNIWFNKFLRSCQTIKVYVGSVNFVEDLTPLNIEDFVARQTASLMLLDF